MESGDFVSRPKDQRGRPSSYYLTDSLAICAWKPVWPFYPRRSKGKRKNVGWLQYFLWPINFFINFITVGCMAHAYGGFMPSYVWAVVVMYIIYYVVAFLLDALKWRKNN